MTTRDRSGRRPTVTAVVRFSPPDTIGLWRCSRCSSLHDAEGSWVVITTDENGGDERAAVVCRACADGLR